MLHELFELNKELRFNGGHQHYINARYFEDPDFWVALRKKTKSN